MELNKVSAAQINPIGSDNKTSKICRWKEVAVKVMVVSVCFWLVLFPIFSILALPVAKAQPLHFQGSNHSFSNVEIISGTPRITKFPNYLTRVVHPGYIMDKTGTRMCMIPETGMIPPKECDKVSGEYLLELEKSDPLIIKILDQEPYKRRGNHFTLPERMKTKIEMVSYNNNPEKLINYNGAIFYLENNILRVDKPFSNGVDVVKCLKETHILLAESSERKLLQGGFRDFPLISHDVNEMHNTQKN